MSTPQDYATAVLILTPQGIPLVRDPKKPLPHYWKLPGGRSQDGETAGECAVREIREELGVGLREQQLTVLHRELKGNHTLVIFQTSLAEMPSLRTHGDEREDIAVFSPQEILAMPDFSPNHRLVIKAMLQKLLENR